MASCQNATGAGPAGSAEGGTGPHPPTASGRGVLQPAESARHFDLSRQPAGEALADLVENYWTVSWDLPPGRSYRSEVLPHPAVHLTVETGVPGEVRHGYALPAGLVHGVVTRRFTADLSGSGRVIGVKFRPGGFAALTGRSVAELTDRVLLAGDVLRHELGAVVEEVLAREAAAPADGTSEVAGRAPEPIQRALVAPLERALERRWAAGARDPAYQQVLAIVRGMLEDRELTRVEDVAERFDVTVRGLQRLFRHYVGASPKWVLRRYRLHDAAWLIDEGRAPDLAALAVELGWADQAHFGRDFAAVLGVPPGRYRARAEQARAEQARAEQAGETLPGGEAPGAGTRRAEGRAGRRGSRERRPHAG